MAESFRPLGRYLSQDMSFLQPNTFHHHIHFSSALLGISVVVIALVHHEEKHTSRLVVGPASPLPEWRALPLQC